MKVSGQKNAERGFGSLSGLVAFAICALVVALIIPFALRLSAHLGLPWIRAVGYSVTGVFAAYGLWGLICQIAQDCGRRRKR